MKASNKFAIIMAVIFIVLPCISYGLMNNKLTLTKRQLSPIVMDLTKEIVVESRIENGGTIIKRRLSDRVNVLKIDGIRTSKGLLSVSPVSPIRGNDNTICLNLEASSIKLQNDTLFINIDDPSKIYQGFIRLRGLQTYILNNDTISYK